MTRTSDTGQPEFDTSTPAVVLKLDPNVLHHGGLGVIRGLGRFGVPVYAVHEERLAPAAHSRHLRGRWLWRPQAEDPERLVAGLLQLSERLGQRAVLFPTDDAGAVLLAEQGSELRERFAFPAPPSELPRQVADKYSLHELCRGLGFPSAESVLVTGMQEAREFADRIGFPLFTKLATPWLSTGAPSTAIVRTWGELEQRCRRSAESGAGDLMLQEFLPGGRGRDWFFHGYCDAASRCEPACTGVKERSYPAHAGLTSLGTCRDNPVLRQEAADLLRRLEFRGVVDLDFRYDGRDDSYKLLDFNPRLGAQFRLFRNAAGVDVALAAYLDLTGQRIPHGEPLAGRRFLVENYDPIGALGYWRRGELGFRDWVRSLRAIDETAWFARDDLLPFGLMALWMGYRAASRWRRMPTPAAPSTRTPAFAPGRGALRPLRRGPTPWKFVHQGPRFERSAPNVAAREQNHPRGRADHHEPDVTTAVGEDRT